MTSIVGSMSPNVITEASGTGTGRLNRRPGAMSGCAADRAVVVSTTDASALRDAQRTVSVLRNRIPRIHLVVNRVQPRLLRRLHTTIDDAMDAAGLPLLGIVPEDPQVMLCANQGQPLILRASRGAAVAYLNIAKRLLGQKAPLMKMR